MQMQVISDTGDIKYR